jgi:para-nitrobenzyl esterase
LPSGGSARLYHFSHNPQTGRTIPNSVVHGLEIPYVYNTLSSMGNKIDRDIAEQMLQRWVSFARTGNPDGGMNPVWPKYKRDDDQHLEFGDKVRVETGLNRDACDFLDRKLF